MAIRKAKMYGVLETQDGNKSTRMGKGPFMESTLQTDSHSIVTRLYDDGKSEVSIYDGPMVNYSALGKPIGQVIRRDFFDANGSLISSRTFGE